MTKSSKSASTKVDTTKASAAKEELDTLEKLSRGVLAVIAGIVGDRARQFEKRALAYVDIAIQENRHSMLKGYEELGHHCYGRTAVGREENADGKSEKPFVYRITQANVGYADDNCFVLARNSPLASALVTARPATRRKSKS